MLAVFPLLRAVLERFYYGKPVNTTIRAYYLFTFGVCLIFSLFLTETVSGAEKVAAGTPFPNIRLNTSDAPESVSSLRLKNPKSFSVLQLPARFILIEIFSLYCPICHKQAPAVNRIYKIIQQDPVLSKDIKVIGIGAGNNLQEINVYRDKLHVPFPLFTDHDFTIHKQLEEPRTPFLILVSSKGRVLLTHSGEIKDFDEFLGMLKKTCGYQ
jgi:hypothetical protein